MLLVHMPSLHQASSPGVRVAARPQQQGGTVVVP